MATGEVVGAFSFSVGHGVNVLRKVASARLLHPPFDISNVVTYPLKGRVGSFSPVLYAVFTDYLSFSNFVMCLFE